MKFDDLKIILKGAMGAMGSIIFGAYHLYITTNMINENNRNNQFLIDQNNRINQIRFNELFKKIEKLEK